MSVARIFVLVEDERDVGLVGIARGLGDVVAISAGAPDAASRSDAALVRALGAGATSALHIVDSVLEGVDYLAVSQVLASAVRHLSESEPTMQVIVVAGDRGRGAVGPAVAERLGVPHLASVTAVERRGEGLLVHRRCGAKHRGYVGTPPVVLACVCEERIVADTPTPATHVELFDFARLKLTVLELQHRRRFRPGSGAVPRARPHLVSNVESLSDRLVRDGLWPIPPTEGNG